MSVIIRLQNLPLSASSLDIRSFFNGLQIPDGGVHIVGGREGDAFIAFSTDEDARQAMALSGQSLKDSPIKLLLSSRNEMFKVIEQTRLKSMGFAGSGPDASGNPTPEISPIQQDIQAHAQALQHPSLGGALSDTMTPNLSLAGLSFHPGLLGATAAGTNSPGTIPGFPNLKLTPQQQQQQQQQLSALGAAGFQGMNSLLQAQNPFALAGLGTQNPMAQLAFPGMIPQGFFPTFPPQPNNAQTQAQQLQQLQNASLPGPFGNNPTVSNTATVRPMGMGLNLNPMVAAGGTGASMHGSLPISQSQNSSEVSSSSGTSSRPTRFSQAPSTSSQQLDPFGTSRASNKLSGSGRPGADLGRGGRARSPDRRDADRRRRSRSREKQQRESRFSNSHRDRSRSRSPERSRTRGNLDSPRGNTTSNNRHQSPHRSSSSFNSKKPLASKSTDGRQQRDERRVSSGAESNDLIIDEKSPLEFPAVQLTGVPAEATFRDIREFIRAEIRGGYEGVVRDYNAGIALVRLDKPSDFIRVARKSGKWNICGSVVRVVGITLEKWELESQRQNGPSGSGSDRRRNSRDEPPHTQSRIGNPSNTSSGPCTLVITGLPIHYSGQDIFKVTLGNVDETLFSDIHVHEERRDANGLESATAYVKFFQRHDAERACEIVSSCLKGPHQKVRVGEIDELIRIRDSGRARPDIPSTAPVPVATVAPHHQNQYNGVSNSNDPKSLFEVDVGDVDPDPDSTTILMKGLPYKIEDRDIFDFFSDLGLAPANVKIVQDAQGTRNGQVLVEFQNNQQATRACSKNGMVFGRFPITVTILPRGARPGVVIPRGPGSSGAGPAASFGGPRFTSSSPRDENPFVQALNNATGPVLPPRGPPPMRYGGGGPPMRGRGMGRGRGGGPRGPSRFNNSGAEGHGRCEKDLMGIFERPGCVLSVTNIPFASSMEDIHEFFQKILNKEILRGKIIRRYNEHNKPTGDARIAFDNTYEASEALSLIQGSTFWNRPLSVSIFNTNNNV